MANITVNSYNPRFGNPDALVFEGLLYEMTMTPAVRLLPLTRFAHLHLANVAIHRPTYKVMKSL
jgi:hypothetical protein